MYWKSVFRSSLFITPKKAGGKDVSVCIKFKSRTQMQAKAFSAIKSESRRHILTEGWAVAGLGLVPQRLWCIISISLKAVIYWREVGYTHINKPKLNLPDPVKWYRKKKKKKERNTGYRGQGICNVGLHVL